MSDPLTQMPAPAEPIRRFYADWSQYRSRLVGAVRDLTPDELALSAGPDHRQLHTRRSILLWVLSHDAFHSGEISQLVGVHGLPAIDLWARRAG